MPAPDEFCGMPIDPEEVDETPTEEEQAQEDSE